MDWVFYFYQQLYHYYDLISLNVNDFANGHDYGDGDDINLIHLNDCDYDGCDVISLIHLNVCDDDLNDYGYFLYLLNVNHFYGRLQYNYIL